MTAPKIGRLATRGAASYNAAAHIYKHGPQTPEQLYAVADFGHKMSHKEDKLSRALANGWLTQGTEGKIDIGTVARAHFTYEAGETAEKAPASVKPDGQIAAPRQIPSVFTRPQLSRKHIPNPRGLRQDIPSWSLRPEGFCFKSIAGGDV